MCCRAIKQIPENIALGLDNVYKGLSLGVTNSSDAIGGFCGFVSYKVASGVATGCKKVKEGLIEGLKKGAFKTANYIKENWGRLLAYLLGWTLILVCAGFINGYNPTSGLAGVTLGFKAVSLPMTIGLGCGFAFGGILGILFVKAIFKEDRPIEDSSLWGYLNKWNNQVSDFGTHAIMVAAGVTVVLALAYRYPYAGGAVFGAVIGNHLAVKMCRNVPLGPNPKAPIQKTLQEELEDLQKERLQFDEKMRAFEEKLNQKDKS